MNSLSEIQTTLKAALQNESLFALLNTRIVLRTGVDLNRMIDPKVDGDAALVGKVMDTLAALGYSSASLRTVAKRRDK